MLTLLTGGARSGKSTVALDIAHRDGGHVTFIATATAGDHDMAARIATHQAQRPTDWDTIEEPNNLQAALAAVDDDQAVVLDCLTLWLANVSATPDARILEAARQAAAMAAGRRGTTVVVTNEVGAGIVPDNVATRRYRDLLGHVNATWAEVADRAFLVVAGRLLALEDVDEALAPAVRQLP